MMSFAVGALIAVAGATAGLCLGFLWGVAQARKADAAVRLGRYGAGRTIHQTGHVDVETHNGKVVSVWFRCLALPFRQSEVHEIRAHEMAHMAELHEPPSIHEIVLRRE